MKRAFIQVPNKLYLNQYVVCKISGCTVEWQLACFGCYTQSTLRKAVGSGYILILHVLGGLIFMDSLLYTLYLDEEFNTWIWPRASAMLKIIKFLLNWPSACFLTMIELINIVLFKLAKKHRIACFKSFLIEHILMRTVKKTFIYI